VEDNLADVRLTQRALKVGRIANELTFFQNGRDAFTFLEGCIRGENEVPDMILMDINLPSINGFELLRIVRESTVLATIPVVMLTSSDSEDDIDKSYRHHANSYICKPVQYADFLRVVQTLDQFWFQIVKLPRPRAKQALPA
jgi:CheY-like chemotaxis protein